MSRDLIRMNDWQFPRFLRLAVVFHFAWMIAFLWETELGTRFPAQFVGLMYLTYFPGAAILRTLRLHFLPPAQTLVYSVGLSLFFLTSSGMSLNVVGPLLGVQNPLSSSYVLATITILTFGLYFLAYVRDGHFVEDPPQHVSCSLSYRPLALLFVPPVWTVVGNLVFNETGNNAFTMIALLMICLSFVFVGLSSRIKEEYLPYVVLSLSSSLLLHTSLVSHHLWGYDINLEYFLSHRVLENSIWNPVGTTTFESTSNGMLSLMILPPVLSLSLDMDLVWIFKVVYPLFFALVPVGLYIVYARQIGSKPAFLAVMFFVSMFVFFTTMSALAKQELAEFYMVLCLMLLLDNIIPRITRSLLLIIFLFCLVVSHYGVSYYFAFLLIFGLILNSLGSRKGYATNDRNSSYRFPLILLGFIFVWYCYVSGSAAFAAVVRLVDQVGTTFYKEFLNPAYAQGIAVVLTGTVTPLHRMAKYLHLLCQFIIVIGFILAVWKRKSVKMDKDYRAFSWASLLVMFAGISLPFFAHSLDVTRLYHLGLMILAPYLVIGIMYFGAFLSKIIHNSRVSIGNNKVGVTMAVSFLAVFLLFNTEFVYQISDDVVESIALNPKIEYPRFNEMEYAGADWLVGFSDDVPLYADAYRSLLLGSFDWERVKSYPQDLNSTPRDNYAYFGTVNSEQGRVLIRTTKDISVSWSYVSAGAITEGNNRIYDAGGASVFFGGSN